LERTERSALKMKDVSDAEAASRDEAASSEFPTPKRGAFPTPKSELENAEPYLPDIAEAEDGRLGNEADPPTGGRN
jgi:hypothetical protein